MACEITDGAMASKGKRKDSGAFFAGVSHSPVVVAAYLMNRKGVIFSLETAPRQTFHSREQISLNVVFLQWLREM